MLNILKRLWLTTSDTTIAFDSDLKYDITCMLTTRQYITIEN